MKTILPLFFALAMMLPAQAQITVELSIENQEVLGSDFYFDIYLTRHAGSDGDVFLADMDLVLNFNSQFFTAPELTPVGNDFDLTGHCLFSPVSVLPQAEMDCRMEYFSKTATTLIEDNLLIINLFGPEPPDSATFAGLVAWVDGQPETHRLGRFKISGINTQSGTAGLVWAESQTGTMTKVFSFQNFAPWTGKPVDVLTTPPPDIGLDSMVTSTSDILGNVFFIENIYPNPVIDELNVEVFFPNNGMAFFMVTDLNGHMVWKKEMVVLGGKNLFRVDVSDWPGGGYFFGVRQRGMVRSFLFFK